MTDRRASDAAQPSRVRLWRAKNTLPGNRLSVSIRFRVFGVVRYFEVTL